MGGPGPAAERRIRYAAARKTYVVRETRNRNARAHVPQGGHIKQESPRNVSAPYCISVLNRIAITSI